MVSRKLSIRDEPNIGLRRSRNVKNHLFYRGKNVPVCTFKTSPFVPAPRAHVFQHVCAWCRYTRGLFERTHGDVLSGHTEFRSVSHTNTHTHINTHINTHNTNTTPHHTTTQHNTTHYDHNTTRRKRETETDRDRERRHGQREKRRRKRRDKTREERRFILLCGGAWPFLLV